jgi:hypothetical protein
MKSVGTKAELEELEKKLKEIRKLTPLLSKTITKQKRRDVVLNSKNFYQALDLVLEIKNQLNEPLNKNHLIFTNKEEFDPKAYKKQIMDDAISRG